MGRYRLRRYKSAAWILVTLAVFYGTARFCHHETKGFQLTKISNNLTEGQNSLPYQDTRLVNTLLDQKFRYFGRGKQSFAFLSEDGEYILKIFNNAYPSKISIFSRLAHLPFFKKWAQAKKTLFQNKRDRTFASYKIAFEEMQEQTALLYTHLHQTTDLPHSVTLIDRLNIEHPIDPNTLGFVIQKKVDLVYPALKKMIDQGEIEEAHQAISSLLHLFFWKYNQGIADNDPLIRTNYGLLEGKAIQIDIGPLSKDPELLSKERQRGEIEKTLASLKFWLTQNAPSLIVALDRELQELLLYSDDAETFTPK